MFVRKVQILKSKTDNAICLLNQSATSGMLFGYTSCEDEYERVQNIFWSDMNRLVEITPGFFRLIVVKILNGKFECIPEASVRDQFVLQGVNDNVRRLLNMYKVQARVLEIINPNLMCAQV